MEKIIDAPNLVEQIQSMSDEDIQEVYHKLNPYSFVAPEINDERLVSFSYTNMRHEHMKHLQTTALIGFLYRHLREWKTPEGIQSVSVEEYLKNPKCIEPYPYLLEPSTNASAKQAKDAMLAKYAEYKETMKKKTIIHEFLSSLFDFNADEHVISALKVNNTDTKRKLPDTPAVRKAIETKNTVSGIAKHSYEMEPTSAVPATSVIDSKLVATDAFTHIPPADMFAKFERYMGDHYEELLDTTYRLYGSRNDTDLAIIFYDKHASADEAKIFKERHANEFNVPITRIKQNRWVLLGPYKKNREAVDWLSSQTDVLKEMLDKRGEDEKLMNEIMIKAAKRKKMQEIAEQGPDNEAVEKYFKDNQPAISSLGAKQIQLTPDERKKAIEMYKNRQSRMQPMSASSSSATTNTSLSTSTTNTSLSTSTTNTSSTHGPIVVSAQPSTTQATESTRKFIESMDAPCPKDLVEIPVITISGGGSEVSVKKIYNNAEAPVKL